MQSVARHRQVYGRAIAAGLDGVVHEMDERLVERFGIAEYRAGLAADHMDVAGTIVPGDQPANESTQVECAARGASPGAVPAEPPEQRVELVGTVGQGDEHILAEHRVVGVALRISREQRELAGKVLDVVHHERDAAVEFVESRGFDQCAVADLLGKVAGELAADHLEKVEILPV
jgi:hypothetical protein